MKIKRELEPLLYDYKKKMIQDNEKNKPSDQYFKKLSNMTEIYGVESKFAKSANEEKSLLDNATVSLSYIRDYLDVMKKHVYSVHNTVALKVEEYQKIANQFNISIDEDVTEIQSHIEAYKSTDVFYEFYKEHDKKTEILKELDTYIRQLMKDSWDASMKGDIPNNTFIGQNYPTDFRKSPELVGLVDILDRAKEEFKNYFVEGKHIVDLTDAFALIDNTDEIFKSIHIKLRAVGYQSCIADTYADQQKDKSVLGFLKSKNEEDLLADKKTDIYTLPEWSNTQRVIIFADSSALIQNNRNEYQEVLSSKDMVELRSRLLGEYINEQFKKNPTIAKTFKQMKDIAYVEYFDTFTKILNKYKENEPVLKLNEFALLSTFKEAAANNEHSFTIYEKFDDAMSKTIRDHKVKQFIHSIASKKYDHLYNEETYKLAGELYDMKLPDNSLQDYVGKKLAAFKTPEQFNGALNKFLGSLNSFTLDATKAKATTYGVEVISENDNKLILRIKDFDESHAMGSSSWCISRDESYFKSYADYREQYFIFDFSKDKTDNSSMIGVTLETNGDYSTAHYKDDSECEEDEEEMIQYLQDEVYEYKKGLKTENVTKIEQKEKLKI
jgi:hypothetical protein